MLDAIRKDLNHDFISFYTKGFEDGALSEKEIFIKKACEWLKKTMYIHTEHDTDVDWGTTTPSNWVTSDYDTVDEFIDGFRKAMEE